MQANTLGGRRCCCRPLPGALLLAALAAGCVGDPPSAASGASAALPLPLGFYVSTDTPCGEASNATLARLHADGLNGARDFCRFASLGRTGPSTFRAVESCTSIGAAEAWSIVVDWEILGPTAFRRTSEEGWVSEFRFCDQPSLPEPWRDNDI